MEAILEILTKVCFVELNMCHTGGSVMPAVFYPDVTLRAFITLSPSQLLMPFVKIQKEFQHKIAHFLNAGRRLSL